MKKRLKRAATAFAVILTCAGAHASAPATPVASVHVEPAATGVADAASRASRLVPTVRTGGRASPSESGDEPASFFKPANACLVLAGLGAFILLIHRRGIA